MFMFDDSNSRPEKGKKPLKVGELFITCYLRLNQIILFLYKGRTVGCIYSGVHIRIKMTRFMK